MAGAVFVSRQDETLSFSFQSEAIGCTLCEGRLFSRVVCPSCEHPATSVNRIFIGCTYDTAEKAVKDAFEEELKGYDL